MGMIDGFTNLIFNVYEAFTVALFVRHNENLKCISYVSFANSFDKKRNIPVEGSLPGWVMKHNEPLIIPNFDKDESTLGYYGSPEDIKSFMGFPMENKGVIVVDSKKKWVFTDKEKKILKSFVSVIHEEIENEKRFIDMEDKLYELNAERKILNLFSELNQSKISVSEIFKECMILSHAGFCFVGIEKNGKMFIHDIIGLDSDQLVNKECPSGNSIASLVMEGGRELLLPHSSRFLVEKPLFFPGEAVRVKQFFGFPLIISDITFGMVGFATSADNGLKEHNINFLRNISTLMSLYYSSLWMRENLEKLKDFEPVTDALQFPVFLEISNKAIRRSDKFSLVSIKIPGIKFCNRHMGLDFTNGILKKVFHIIKNCAGSRSLITRKSGGHFFVLLKDVDSNEINGIVRILHYSIAKGIAEEKIENIMDNMEIGVAFFPEDSSDLWELLDKADQMKLVFKNK